MGRRRAVSDQSLPFFESDFYKKIIENVSTEDKFRFLDRLPTVPGKYVDQDGEPWTLTEDMRWCDKTGHSEDPQHNWVLGINEKNTWTPVVD